MKTLTKTISILILLTSSLINTNAIANENHIKVNALAVSEDKKSPKDDEPIEPLKLICKLMPQMCI